jgi:hypothetical protein
MPRTKLLAISNDFVTFQTEGTCYSRGTDWWFSDLGSRQEHARRVPVANWLPVAHEGRRYTRSAVARDPGLVVAAMREAGHKTPPYETIRQIATPQQSCYYRFTPMDTFTVSRSASAVKAPGSGSPIFREVASVSAFTYSP